MTASPNLVLQNYLPATNVTVCLCFKGHGLISKV